MMRSRLMLAFGMSALFTFVTKSPVLLSVPQQSSARPGSVSPAVEDLYERLSDLEQNRKAELSAADAADVRAAQADDASASLDPALAANAANAARSARSSA